MGPTIRQIFARLRQRRSRGERVFLRRVYIPLFLLPQLQLTNSPQVNRNKKSLGLSFQHAAGVEILHKLAAEADILIENYLPGTLQKYNLDYATLSSINPRLIYASITGYGQTGPYSNRAGYDVMVEAEMGLMHITGSRDGPPVKVGVAVTDLTTGLYTSNSIMAAIIARGKSGRGQHIDVALSDCQVATLANLASSCLVSGERDEGRWGTAHRARSTSFLAGKRLGLMLWNSIDCPIQSL
jgi:succinate--hydroxymethylglutarate CoA-transferase